MKLKPQILLIVTFMAIALLSCKKKTAPIEALQSQVLPETEPVPRSDSINGLFRTSKGYRIEKGQMIFTQMYHNASFSKELRDAELFFAPSYEDVGDVYLDNAKFEKYGNGGYGSGQYFNSPTLEWKITGNNSFKPFSCQLDFCHPTFEGQGYLQDSLYKNSAMQIFILGTDADSISIEFKCQCSEMIIKKAAKDKSIILSINDIYRLTNMGQFQPVYMRIILSKTLFKTFGGKYYKFITETFINKEIYPVR